MLDPRTSPLFEAYTQPDTGLDIWLLTADAAPVQQSFYFTNDGLSGDGRYFWFYYAHPPSGSGSYGRMLGVVAADEGGNDGTPQCGCCGHGLRVGAKLCDECGAKQGKHAE